MVLWELPVLGESAVQLAGSASTEQVVHLVRAQPALRVRPVLQKRPGCGWCLGWRKWGRR